MPNNLPMSLLASTDRHLVASDVLEAMTGSPPRVCSALIAALDAGSAAILATAGSISADDARAVLAELWGPERQ